jgi:hypothetical protein
MRRLFFAVAVLTFASTGVAFAQDTESDAPHHPSIGVGMRSSAAPLGLRWWFSGQKVGLDVGLGFVSVPAGIDPDEREMTWAIEAGVPFVLSSWERVHVLLRPGLVYQSQEIGFDEDPTTPGVQFDTESQTTFTVTGEIEGELFLARNFSVSASHGIGFASVDPAFGGDSQTIFGTLGNQFTEVGFHIYWPGGSAR